MLHLLAHFLLPRPSNNHKAKLLHSSTLSLVIIFVILFQVVFQFENKATGQVLGYAANINPTEIEKLTNVERKNNGLSELTDSTTLDTAAYAKGKDMLAKGYWAHVAPDGTQPWTFFVSANYSYQYAGENLARDFSDAPSAVSAWMASPTHRDNILSTHYKEIGVAVVEGNLAGVDTTIIVQFFGTKLGSSLPSIPVAQAKTPAPSNSPKPIAAIASLEPSPLPLSTPLPLSNTNLVASAKVSPFAITKYFSLALVILLILVIAVDGFLINKRKIFRIAGHFPAHIAFLSLILVIVIIAKVGRII